MDLTRDTDGRVDMDAWLTTTKLVVCVGSGGVGKTTTSAALGLYAAVHGRKVMVLTIDPAKRLANSLGLNAFGNEETRIDLSSLSHATGELWAMMLDSQSTMDGLIGRVAPSPEARDRILGNHVYQHMASAFAGTQDYMATEKLYDLVASGKYDLVILDTPPVKNALDFLESPGRLINFLDEKVLSWFLVGAGNKGGFGARLFQGTSQIVLKLLGTLFGADFVSDLTVFFEEFQGLYAGFVERHDRVLAMLRSRDTHFVTVCAPTESSLDVAVYFQEELERRDLPRAGVVVNQMHRCTGDHDDAKAVLGELAATAGADLSERTVAGVLARLSMAHKRLRALSAAEQLMTARVRQASRGAGFYQEVARLEGQVHDLPSLHQVGELLFEPALKP